MSSFSSDDGKFSVESTFVSAFVTEPNLSSKARAPRSLCPQPNTTIRTIYWQYMSRQIVSTFTQRTGQWMLHSQFDENLTKKTIYLLRLASTGSEPGRGFPRSKSCPSSSTWFLRPQKIFSKTAKTGSTRGLQPKVRYSQSQDQERLLQELECASSLLLEPELEPRTQRSIWNPELDKKWIRCASTREHQERSLSCTVVTNKKKRDDSHKMMHWSNA